MLATLDYVERATANVLPQRHKSAVDGKRQIAGIFMNYFMFLTSGGGVSEPLSVQCRNHAPQALPSPE